MYALYCSKLGDTIIAISEDWSELVDKAHEFMKYVPDRYKVDEEIDEENKLLHIYFEYIPPYHPEAAEGGELFIGKIPECRTIEDAVRWLLGSDIKEPL